MFRTATGQTGRDAYINEAAAIANAQRELDERMRRLCQAIHDESPELLHSPTDYHPQLRAKATMARNLQHYLSLSLDGYYEWLRSER